MEDVKLERCPHCGSETTSAARYCGACGRALQIRIERRLWAGWVVVGLGLLAAVVCGAGIFYLTERYEQMRAENERLRQMAQANNIAREHSSGVDKAEVQATETAETRREESGGAAKRGELAEVAGGEQEAFSREGAGNENKKREVAGVVSNRLPRSEQSAQNEQARKWAVERESDGDRAGDRGVVGEEIRLAPNSFTVGARSYKSFRFAVPVEWGLGVVRGWFRASGGMGNDIRMFITDAYGLENFHNGHAFNVWFDSGKATVGFVNARLSPGEYYLVAANDFSLITPKAVQCDIVLVRAR